jgi:cardiolipin-specific phospholipase
MFSHLFGKSQESSTTTIASDPEAITAVTPKTGCWVQTNDFKGVEAEEKLLEGLVYIRERVPIDVGRSEHFVNTIRLNSETGAEKHIVIAHGYGAGLGFFFKNLGALQQTGAKIHAVDWLGMANSSRPILPYLKKKRLSIEHIRPEDAPEYLDHNDIDAVDSTEAFFIDSLEQWRHKSDIPKMTLIGHSLGGYLSAAYALKYPERVEKLVLVSPVGVPEAPPHIASPHLNNSGNASNSTSWLIKVARKLWAWDITPQAIIRTVGPYGPSLVGKYTSARFKYLELEEKDKLRDYLYHISAQKGSGEYALSRLLIPGAFAKWPIGKRLEKLPMGVTFIYGKQDWMDYQHAEKALKNHTTRLGDRKIMVVDKAGHHLYLDNPDGFNHALLQDLGFHAENHADVELVDL